MRHAHFIAGVALVAAAVLVGCRSEQQVAQNGTSRLKEGTPLTFTTNESVAVRL